MNETKWTPGPWIAQQADDESWEILTGDGRDIALAYLYGFAAEPPESNAALIAAAPDLYDALAECHDMLQEMLPGTLPEMGEHLVAQTGNADWRDLMHRVKDALERAEGTA